MSFSILDIYFNEELGHASYFYFGMLQANKVFFSVENILFGSSYFNTYIYFSSPGMLKFEMHEVK